MCPSLHDFIGLHKEGLRKHAGEIRFDRLKLYGPLYPWPLRDDDLRGPDCQLPQMNAATPQARVFGCKGSMLPPRVQDNHTAMQHNVIR